LRCKNKGACFEEGTAIKKNDSPYATTRKSPEKFPSNIFESFVSTLKMLIAVQK
jgi:hypothetical protein